MRVHIQALSVNMLLFVSWSLTAPPLKICRGQEAGAIVTRCCRVVCGLLCTSPIRERAVAGEGWPVVIKSSTVYSGVCDHRHITQSKTGIG